ncbi:hypothetical protein TrVE_jg3238 [Triparma verrucosa]|uniref:Uncharacterized protein n=1 Tax=Triparma verrucosa TaxID=1606542 RepID=A0A9W7C0G0_9STRA|nr:hypothetical protein TrVE_jg3238 [Triparma verrucosa]
MSANPIRDGPTMGTIADLLIPESKKNIHMQARDYRPPLLMEEVMYAEAPRPSPAESAQIEVALNRYLANLPPEESASDVDSEDKRLTKKHQYYGKGKYSRYRA